MGLSYQHDVNAATIAFEAPLMFLATWLAARHGFRRGAGWIYLVFYALVRILGAALQLATLAAPTSLALYRGALVLSNIGLSPLLLALVGLIQRLFTDVQHAYPVRVRTLYVRLLEVLIAVGLILGIVGGVRAGKHVSLANPTFHPDAELKAAIVIFIVAFAIEVAMLCVNGGAVRRLAHAGERNLFFALAASVPFLIVRLVYGGLSVFDSGTEFRPIGGDVTTFLCMALLMEYISAVLWVAAGFTLDVLAERGRREKEASPNRGGSV